MTGTLLAGIFIGIVLGFVLYWIMERFLLGVGPTPQEKYLSEQLAATEAKVASLQADLDASAGSGDRVYVRADRLEKVNGIGKVYAQKLNEAGIYTFAQLAQETTARLKEIISPESWQTIEPEAWIAEASTLAADGG